MIAFNAHFAAADDQVPIEKPSDGARIDDMLLPENPSAERLCAVAFSHRNLPLNDDGSVVELCGDEVNRAAVNLRAGIERPLMGIKPGECWKERWMDVQHPACIALDEL